MAGARNRQSYSWSCSCSSVNSLIQLCHVTRQLLTNYLHHRPARQPIAALFITDISASSSQNSLFHNHAGTSSLIKADPHRMIQALTDGFDVRDQDDLIEAIL